MFLNVAKHLQKGAFNQNIRSPKCVSSSVQQFRFGPAAPEGLTLSVSDYW